MQIQSYLSGIPAFQPLSRLRVKNLGSQEGAASIGKAASNGQITNDKPNGSVRARFAEEMARRMAAAPVTDSQGKPKDYQPLLDSLVRAMDSIESHTDAKTATAAMAIVLQNTSDRFSEASLSEGLCGALVYVHEQFGASVCCDVAVEWNQVDLKYVLSEIDQANPGKDSNIAYAMVKYFNGRIEKSSNGGSARMLAFQGNGGEGGVPYSVERDVRYIYSREIGLSTGATSHPSEFKTSIIKDDLQLIVDYFRNDMKNEKAADIVQNMPEDGVYEEDMVRALSVIYRELGLDGLKKAASYLSNQLVGVINEKVAKCYTDEYGDKLIFTGVSVIDPLPEYKKFTCEVSFDWGQIRSSDGYFGGGGGKNWSMDELYSETTQVTKGEGVGRKTDQLLPTPNTTSGILVDKTV